MQACLSGEKVDFAGDFYQVKGFRLGVRLGERAPEGRRRRAQPGDAARWPASWPTACCSTTCPRRTCRGRSSRSAPAAPADVYAYVHAGVCEREDGIELARRDLFSYAVVDSYARNFERAGFGDEVAAIRERHAAGDRDGALAAVSRRMVDAIDVMGDEDTVQATMRAYVDAGVDVPVLMPLPWGADRRGVGRPGHPRRRRDGPSRWSSPGKVALVTGGATGSAGRCASASWPRAPAGSPSSTSS